jgi:hypothetical protein
MSVETAHEEHRQYAKLLMDKMVHWDSSCELGKLRWMIQVCSRFGGLTWSRGIHVLKSVLPISEDPILLFSSVRDLILHFSTPTQHTPLTVVMYLLEVFAGSQWRLVSVPDTPSLELGVQ